MTDTTPVSASAVKRRQYLLLAGIAGLIAGAALHSVSLTGSRDPNERPGLVVNHGKHSRMRKAP